MRSSVKSIVLLALMLMAALTAWAFRPTKLLADQRPKVEVEQLLPRQFGDWHELQQSSGQIINPQQTSLLQKLYTQTLSRSYINSNGVVIMLSIAYGVNQSDGVALHYPEICYPAQGFQVLSDLKDTIETGFGSLTVRRLMTKLGNRSEPVTYWSTLGDKVVQSGMDTKLAQLDYGFKGLIPDGLIFRISSINPEATKGYEVQNEFTRELVAALSDYSRVRLVGISSKKSE